jgi:hypothetical protein
LFKQLADMPEVNLYGQTALINRAIYALVNGLPAGGTGSYHLRAQISEKCLPQGVLVKKE